MYSVLMSLPSCPVTWQANFSSTGPIANGPVATDRFLRLTFLSLQAASPVPCQASLSLFHQPRSSTLLSHGSPCSSHPMQAAGSSAGKTLSTHVKLQLLPKSIPMASCCAEEMLISSSPPVLDSVQAPLAPLHFLMKKADWAGGGHIYNSYTYVHTY